jgi:hypothetical protein
MANNRAAIFVRAPLVMSKAGAVIGPSANTAQDGTGANTFEVFQAKDTAGTGTDTDSKVYYIRLKSAGSPAATVARVFLYIGSSGTFTPGTSNTAANTFMLSEITLPAITTSNTVAQPDFTIPLNLDIPAGNRLVMTFGTSTGAAGTGYVATVVGGLY